MRGEGPSVVATNMRQAAKAAAALTHESRMRAIIKEHSDYRALKLEIVRHDLADLVA